MEQFKRYVFLPDGRKLAYADIGHEHAWPVFFCHGHSNSRLNLLAFYANNKRAEDLGLRIICIDRPGRGMSSFNRKPSLLQLHKDLEFLADHLGILEFTLAGVNTGASIATHAAEYFGGRLDRLFLFSPWWPPSMPGTPVLARLLQKQPWYHRMNALALLKGAENPKMALRMLSKWASKEEKALMHTEKMLDYYTADMNEAFAQSYAAALWEYQAIAQIPAFQANKLTLPVQIFDGKLDKTAKPALTRSFVAPLNEAEYHHLDGLGHFMLYFLSDQLLELMAKR